MHLGEAAAAIGIARMDIERKDRKFDQVRFILTDQKWRETRPEGWFPRAGVVNCLYLSSTR